MVGPRLSGLRRDPELQPQTKYAGLNESEIMSVELLEVIKQQISTLTRQQQEELWRFLTE